MTRKTLARIGVGATALLAAGAFASPAYAAAPDVTVIVDSTTIAMDAEKVFLSKIKNVGDATATGLLVEVDLSTLTGVVAEPPQVPACEDSTDDKIVCDFGGTLAPNEIFDLPITFTPDAGFEGDAGTFTVTVNTEGDADADNNSTEVAVTVGGKGADIVAWADDVVAGYGTNGEVEPVAPGESAPLFWAIYNFGNADAKGVTLTIQLPEHVMFEEIYEGCDVSEDGRTMNCTVADLVIPVGEGRGGGEEGLLVAVSEDAPGPLTVTGTVSGEALGVVSEGPTVFGAPAPAPEWLEPMDAPADVDGGDNTDEFTVHIGAPVGTGGGGTGGGDGGTLPITGAKAGLIGGVGAAALGLGAALFMLARRRRVVLVAPSDDA